MGFLRRWRETRKYLDKAKKFAAIIDNVEAVASKLESPQRREYIGKWIEDYNEKNKIPIPESLVFKMLDLGYRKINKEKNGTIKKELVEFMVSEGKSLLIRYLPEIIDLAVKLIIHKL